MWQNNLNKSEDNQLDTKKNTRKCPYTHHVTNIALPLSHWKLVCQITFITGNIHTRIFSG